MRIVNILHHSPFASPRADSIRNASFEHQYAIALQKWFPEVEYECWRPQRLIDKVAVSRFLYLALAGFEKRALRRFATIFAISTQEQRYLQRFYNLTNVCFSPAGLDFDLFHGEAHHDAAVWRVRRRS